MAEPGGPIRAVVFDVGETLVDETRVWGEWADWLGVPRLTLSAVLGAVIARGEDHRAALHIVRPGIDLRAEAARRVAAGERLDLDAGDLYPDALPCLRRVRALGYRLGIAGNQPAATETVLRALDVELDLVASSEGWGIEKPDARFFARIADELALPPEAIAYVGDRLDNDVGPAARAGMRAIWLRRGPWALIAGSDPASVAAAGPHAAITSLDDLTDALG